MLTSLTVRALAILAGLSMLPALAQDRGTLERKPLPPLANPDDPKLAAKELFGRATSGAPLEARAIGFYSRGCLAGGTALPLDGETWQVMRLSRNRNWGHPAMVDFLRRFAAQVPKAGWPGILVGDISQPRGGPMLTGHASHQIGLDADIWLTPMPRRTLTREEREFTSATNVVREDRLDIDPSVWTAQHREVLKIAASQREVERVFVNPAIKKALCREAGRDRAWLNKVRPIWGHNYHFHIRLACPAGEEGCRTQDPVPAGDGCDASLDWWFTDEALNPRPGKPRPPITLAGLPAECRRVVFSR